jgi:DNA polymerase-3 subunit delta
MMEFNALIQDIRAGKIRPVYFLFGEEAYFMDALIRAFQEKIVKPETRDFNFDLLNAEETDGESVVNVACSFPLMAERRLIVLKSVQQFSTSDKKRILSYVESPLESTCLVVTANDVDRRQSFYAELSKLAVAVECKPLYENQAVEWVERVVRTKGGQISREAALLMVQQVGTSLWNLSNEIEKLLTFAGPKKNLGLPEVEAVAGFSRKYNTWDFADAVGKRELDKALIVMRKLLQEKASATGLIMELSKRIVLLMRIRAMIDKGGAPRTIAGALKLKPFFLNLYLSQANAFRMAELREANRVLLEADAHIKTGTIEPETVLTLAVYDLVRGKENRRFFTVIPNPCAERIFMNRSG